MFGKKEQKGPTPAKQLYSKKPMSERELAEKAGYYDVRQYRQHREHPELDPEHANWKHKKWTRL